MTQSSSVSQLRSEFDDFLYSPIDEGGDGTMLTVLSALARLDVDPWQEAANLARMSRESATQRLASLFTALPGGPLAHLHSRTVSARLIALLPHRSAFNSTPSEALPATSALNNSRTIIYVIVINMVFMALAFGSQYFTVSRQSPLQNGHSHTLAGSLVAPKAPPPRFVK
jgi:hypothetical protein